ncbi:MAG: KRRI-Interacting protein 1 [Watsoniomyces obsoletus]|nr:MAG: KRRI-Interacting protein 1 [Watsoniomyces obsoletus]
MFLPRVVLATKRGIWTRSKDVPNVSDPNIAFSLLIEYPYSPSSSKHQAFLQVYHCHVKAILDALATLTMKPVNARRSNTYWDVVSSSTGQSMQSAMVVAVQGKS